MKERIAEILAKPTKMKKRELLDFIEVPKDNKLGDYAFPCFVLAKKLKKNPVKIASEIVQKTKNTLEFEKVEAVGAYVNFFVNRAALATNTLKQISKQKDRYGYTNIGNGKKILIDFSSPNIAKPFGIGHIRSTMIGNSVSEIAKFCGFNVIKMNYLGDWGTQFGKLAIGYEKFGDPKKLKKDPINYLLELYVKVSEDEGLEEEAKEWFKQLESGDKQAYNLWKSFKALSLAEFERIYKMLNVKFDIMSGESFYRDFTKLLQSMRKKGILKPSQGALVVDLEKFGLGVALIQKSDGTTIYMTRDIAAALDRHKKYKFDYMLYEVGSEQKLHFRQLFKILELMGNSWAKNCSHIAHGLYLDKDGKKFATRKGKMVFVEDIINDATELAKKEILKREEKIGKKELEERARAIALASIIYGDLKNHRINDILFDIEKFISFEGDTGPYLLYTYARAKSILRKAKHQAKKLSIPDLNDSEKELVSHLARFSQVVANAYSSLAPNVIATYAFQLAQSFNEFYHKNKVIGSESEKFRLTLVDASAQVLKNALSLLGIKVLERM